MARGRDRALLCHCRVLAWAQANRPQAPRLRQDDQTKRGEVSLASVEQLDHLGLSSGQPGSAVEAQWHAIPLANRSGTLIRFDGRPVILLTMDSRIATSGAGISLRRQFRGTCDGREYEFVVEEFLGCRMEIFDGDHKRLGLLTKPLIGKGRFFTNCSMEAVWQQLGLMGPARKLEILDCSLSNVFRPRIFNPRVGSLRIEGDLADRSEILRTYLLTAFLLGVISRW